MNRSGATSFTAFSPSVASAYPPLARVGSTAWFSPARASAPGCLVPRVGDRQALRSAAFILDALGRFGSVVWRSLFGTAAAFCLAGGLLVSLGRPNESSAVMIIAGVLGAVATACALLALRVEPDTDSFGEQDSL